MDITSDTNHNIKFLDLELADLENEKIVQSFTLNSLNYFTLKLNHKYDKKTIPFQFNWNRYQANTV
jgi:hypothetical protein